MSGSSLPHSTEFRATRAISRPIHPASVRVTANTPHAAAWLAIAVARNRDGDCAKSLFDWINPIRHASMRESAEYYRTEPYVVAADIAGVPQHLGRGGWTWYTGAAATANGFGA